MSEGQQGSGEPFTLFLLERKGVCVCVCVTLHTHLHLLEGTVSPHVFCPDELQASFINRKNGVITPLPFCCDSQEVPIFPYLDTWIGLVTGPFLLHTLFLASLAFVLVRCLPWRSQTVCRAVCSHCRLLSCRWAWVALNPSWLIAELSRGRRETVCLWPLESQARSVCFTTSVLLAILCAFSVKSNLFWK